LSGRRDGTVCAEAATGSKASAAASAQDKIGRDRDDEAIRVDMATSRMNTRRGSAIDGLSGQSSIAVLIEWRAAGVRRRGACVAIKADKWIRRMALEHQMIEPFVDTQVRAGVVSYGLSSYGYDIRVADEFKIFTNINNTVIDPKQFDPRSFVDIKADVCIVPPNSFALARTIEYFRIPRDVLTICLGKSTYARCGIIVNVTPFEPEWEGFVTLEISNTTPLPARIYSNEGIAQVLFFQSDEVCERSYADKKGKYQKQQGVVLPKI
jgi:dCTP deaminase